MKKILALLLTICMCASLCACTSKEEPADTQAGADTSEAVDYSTLTSVELAVLMGNGINLGNTMEATDGGYVSSPTAGEVLWGQPVTTQEMIAGMKEAGFDTIRIPVAWTNMMHYEEGDYTIDEALLERVAQIADWAIEADMYVIVNDHWDNGWWGMFGSATQETADAAWEMYESMWTQIGTYFAEYDYHLIFESGNEELGAGFNSTYNSMASDSGALSAEELYTTTNEVNQKFVDVIRGLGGNNVDRFLLIAGFNTNIDITCTDRFVMPTDSAKNRLLVSVHYYDPWNYCGNTDSDQEWGSSAELESMNAALEKMAQFVQDGYGVVIGEYGVLTYGSDYRSLKTNTLTYTKNFLDNCEVYGYTSCLWDTNTFYNKETCQIEDAELAQLYLERSVSAQSSMTQDEIIAQAQAEMDELLERAIADEEAQNEADTASGTTSEEEPSDTPAVSTEEPEFLQSTATLGFADTAWVIQDWATSIEIEDVTSGTYTLVSDAADFSLSSGIQVFVIDIPVSSTPISVKTVNTNYVVSSVKVNGQDVSFIYGDTEAKGNLRIEIYNVYGPTEAGSWDYEYVSVEGDVTMNAGTLFTDSELTIEFTLGAE